MEAKNGRSEEEFEADARNALLAHFSSKSTNETAILIGLAIAIFADFQAYSAFNLPLPWQKITFLTFSLGIIAFFVVRQLSRLICWGQMADAVLIVEMKSKEETARALEENRAKPIEVKLAATYLGQLSRSCDLRFADCKKQAETLTLWNRLPLLICRNTSKKWFIWAFIIAIPVVCGILLIVAHVFSPS